MNDVAISPFLNYSLPMKRRQLKSWNKFRCHIMGSITEKTEVREMDIKMPEISLFKIIKL